MSVLPYAHTDRAGLVPVHVATEFPADHREFGWYPFGLTPDRLSYMMWAVSEWTLSGSLSGNQTLEGECSIDHDLNPETAPITVPWSQRKTVSGSISAVFPMSQPSNNLEGVDRQAINAPWKLAAYPQSVPGTSLIIPPPPFPHIWTQENPFGTVSYETIENPACGPLLPLGGDLGLFTDLYMFSGWYYASSVVFAEDLYWPFFAMYCGPVLSAGGESLPSPGTLTIRDHTDTVLASFPIRHTVPSFGDGDFPLSAALTLTATALWTD